MVKKIFLDKNHKKFAETIWIHVSREYFLLSFLINFLFLKILTKKAKKITFWPKFHFFGAKNAKIFKNKKLSKKSEKTNP